MPVNNDATNDATNDAKLGFGGAPPEGAGGFVSLLSEQRGLYASVLDVARRQAALIERGDTQGLLVVLEERQQLIDDLGLLNQKLIPHREAWSQSVESQPAARRAQVKLLLDQIQALLAGIMKLDEQDRASLESRMSNVDDQLKQIGQGAQAVKVYGTVPKPAAQATLARFTDRRG